MSQYYYLISSLHDLIIDNEGNKATESDFIDLCQREMTPCDFDNMRKLYIFNDIKNIINYKTTGNYISPSYYTLDEFNENIKDTDCFCKFIADFYANKRNSIRLYPNMTEEDELIQMFYDNLDDFCDGFIREYFEFELLLRNVMTATNMRRAGLDYSSTIIKSGDYSENILKNTSPDFGLSNEFAFINKIIDQGENIDLIKTERTIDDIKWAYLDERVERDCFSQNVVFAYAVKLRSVSRWAKLTPARGKSIFEKLITQIKENIKFSEEFIVVGGKR